MPIRFFCSQCRCLLEVPDEIAGRPTECPQCKAIQEAPPQSTPPPADGTYQAQPLYGPPPGLQEVEPSEPVLTKISFSKVFEDTWRIFTRQFTHMILMGLIVGGLSLFMFLAAYLCIGIVVALTLPAMHLSFSPSHTMHAIESSCDEHDGEIHLLSDSDQEGEKDIAENESAGADEEVAEQPPTGELMHDFEPTDIDPTVLIILLTVAGMGLLLGLLVVSLIYLWLYAGQIALMLQLARGKKPSLTVLFSGMKYLGTNICIAAYIAITFMLLGTAVVLPGIVLTVFSLGVSLDGVVHPEMSLFLPGLILCIIGGVIGGLLLIYVNLIYCYGYFFAVDRGEGANESLRHSRQFVQHNFWTILGLVIVLMLILTIVGTVPFAFIVTIPFTVCFVTVIYLAMTGQKIAQ